MKNINIFHISPFPYYTGGIDTWLYSFLTINEKEHTYNVTLYCTGEVQPEKEAAFDITHFKHVNIIYLSTYPGFGLMPLWSIKYLFSFIAKKSGENADLSLALGTVPVLLPLYIMKKLNLLKGEVFCSVRGQIAQDGIDLNKPKFLCWALKTLEGFLLKRVDKVFVNGEDTKAYLKRFYQLDSTVIANGFDDEKLNSVKVPENLPSALAKEVSNKKVLLHVGTLRPIKGIDYILNAYAALDDEAKSKSLLIFVGKGQEAFYKNIAKNLGINVYFLGEKSNPLDYITLADAVINVSGGSGVSNSLLEALAMGKPVIAWDNLTFSQVMDNTSGVLCKTHDVQSLACGFEKIINGEHFDQALVKASVKPYYWSSIWYKWKQYLTQVHVMTKKVLVVTNMYPNKKSPAAGVFVRKMTQQLQENIDFSVALWVIPKVSNKLIAYCLFYLGFVFKLLFFRPKIVYCHFVSHTGLLGVLAKTLLGCKLVLNCHGSDVMNSIHSNKFKFKLNNYLFSRADKIIVPSVFLQSVVHNHFAVLNSKMFIYPSGGIFIPHNQTKKNDNSQQAGAIKIGYVGRLIESKGINVLTAALSKLNNVELLIAGGGDISLVKNNISSQIKLTYLGEVPQHKLHDMYEQIDLLVFPTLLQESLGLTPLEAMAFSVPVIGSNIGAVCEYVINNKTGFIVTPGSVDELASAIVKFTKMTTDETEVLKTNARNMAKKYDEENIRHALTNLINDLA